MLSSRFIFTVTLTVTLCVIIALIANPPTSEMWYVDMSTAKEPVTEEPVTEEPVTEEPVTEEPVTEEPVTEEDIIVVDVLTKFCEQGFMRMLVLFDDDSYGVFTIDEEVGGLTCVQL